MRVIPLTREWASRELTQASAYELPISLLGAVREEIDMSEPTDPNPQESNRRVVIRVPIRVSTIDPDVEPDTGKPYFRTGEELSANLSRRGAFVMTSEPVSPGRRVLLEFALPDGPEIQAVGRVAWTRRPVASPGESRASEEVAGIGIEIVSGKRQHLAALEAFIERQQRPRTRREDAGKGVFPTPAP
jgi:Tfp pilus assembly protein PilZ